MGVVFVDPGAMRTELTLEACTRSDDDLGGFVENWQQIGLAFALIEPVSASSVFAADQTIEQVSHRITLRWRPDITSGMRMTRAGRRFDIVTVHDPDDTGRYLDCRVKEKGA